jgi:hypothetical protein
VPPYPADLCQAEKGQKNGSRIQARAATMAALEGRNTEKFEDGRANFSLPIFKCNIRAKFEK